MTFSFMPPPIGAKTAPCTLRFRPGTCKFHIIRILKEHGWSCVNWDFCEHGVGWNARARITEMRDDFEACGLPRDAIRTVTKGEITTYTVPEEFRAALSEAAGEGK